LQSLHGGKHDEGLNRKHVNTANTQKWVNLYNEMLDDFKRLGVFVVCCTLDSAYMGDILGQIAREEWAMNLVGTCQSDRSGSGAVSRADKLANEE
jgi:hypothetical protein